jgi:ABC-type multidrug transport system ATPase subunit
VERGAEAFGGLGERDRVVALRALGQGPGGEDRGPALVEARGLAKAYRGARVLAGVDLDVHGGELVALVGANGVGKSTLLRLLAGFEPPDAGHVTRRGSVGYVPQEGGLDPQLRPHEHFELFGAARGRSRRAARREGERLARELGWAPDGAPVAAKLSGGTHQKLGVVTAMVAEPDTMLLDEPDQGLDAESTRRLWELLLAWCAGGRAVVVASHGRGAVTWAHRVVELVEPTS